MLSSVKRKYVLPGDMVGEGNLRPLANVYRLGDKLYSTRVGMAEVSREGVRVIPLSGPYIPKVEDTVIGKIVDYMAMAWEVDINSCFLGVLPAQSVFGRDYSAAKDSMVEKLSIGDVIAARITAFDRTRNPLLSVSGHGLGKIPGGEMIKISPVKIPRVIGKKGSMIRTIESSTGCKLIVGQNGVIVVNGSSEGVLKAIEAIKMIEQEAHLADLTQKILNFLSAGE